MTGLVQEYAGLLLYRPRLPPYRPTALNAAGMLVVAHPAAAVRQPKSSTGNVSRVCLQYGTESFHREVVTSVGFPYLVEEGIRTFEKGPWCRTWD